MAHNSLDISVAADALDCLSVKPSEDVASTAGLFFDFSSVNAETIRGKWKSDCCLDVTLTKDFPDHLYRQMFKLSVVFCP